MRPLLSLLDQTGVLSAYRRDLQQRRFSKPSQLSKCVGTEKKVEKPPRACLSSFLELSRILRLHIGLKIIHLPYSIVSQPAPPTGEPLVDFILLGRSLNLL